MNMTSRELASGGAIARKVRTIVENIGEVSLEDLARHLHSAKRITIHEVNNITDMILISTAIVLIGTREDLALALDLHRADIQTPETILDLFTRVEIHHVRPPDASNENRIVHIHTIIPALLLGNIPNSYQIDHRPPNEKQLHPGLDHPPEKQKPNYAPSGKLAAETNTVANTSIVLKYNEPPEARLPPASTPWRLYIFKGDSMLDTLHLHTNSCWLFGRERLVVDCPIDHPSCSKQHAVIQFRYVVVKNEYGDKEGGVKPYIIDLESANGTKVNGDSVLQRRYMELKNKDVITFGESTREYVLMLPPKD
ncbi:hypothetical protein MMC07_006012 [Pseudocyphellaria aurata]|nr:hypothetical protein [Pseudocyphellaria aurata]